MDDIFVFEDDGGHNPYEDLMGASQPREKTIQIIISVVFGLTAFLTFCVLRPRWTGLYAARKKQKDEATALPELPDSLFGWILPVWRITDQQILASAGLDAYAFLTFFKMAMKFLVITFLFSLIVIKPVHDANPDDTPSNGTLPGNGSDPSDLFRQKPVNVYSNGTWPGFNGTFPGFPEDFETDYLWIYVVFAYLFSGIAVYLIVSETRRIIEVRQEYLGTQTSVTDRTILLSGVPRELQDEEKIKEFIESVDIGKVESVTVCRNWKELDETIAHRSDTLRRLEEAYTIYLGKRRVERSLESLPISQPVPPSPRPQPAPVNDDDEEGEDEDAALMGANGHSSVIPYGSERPKTRIRFGFMKLRSKKVDAIDYYEEKLRQADDKVKDLRKKTFASTPLAFVTMDSVAACQMALQAVLDPSPGQFIARPSPAPADVIWNNTYLTRRTRQVRSWCVTTMIVLLTLFWSTIFIFIAGLLTVDSIKQVLPQLAELLEEHENLKSLVNAQLPTLLASLLMVLVPYLYYWLSWYQGFMSQGDVELSAISKNFFFTFFNFFIVFTAIGTTVKFFEFFQQFGDALRDFRKIAYTLAYSLQRFLHFYVNFIILQGLGLFPFRLLEMGSVSLYPVYRIGAKTPRDFAELVQPPIFSYGFYLPNALLIFIICMVYSVLRSSWQVLLAGLIYFAFGHFVYKYQLLYAMDHQQQATGRAWVMICDRIFVGMMLFQVATSGQLLLKQAFARSAMILPLLIATIWFSIVYGRRYKPLMKFIALRSVKQGEAYTDQPPSPPDAPSPDANSTSSNDLAPERNAWAENDSPNSQIRYYRETRTGVGPAVDESNQTGKRFINPSLIAPLDGLWIADKNVRREGEAEVPEHETV